MYYRKKTEVSSESNSYFLKPRDPQRFFFHKLSDQYIREEKISFLPACWWDAYLGREGARWKILLPCSSIIRRTISHFFELLPRIHSYFTHKNIIFGLFTVLFPSAEPFFCHSVYEQRREWRYTCSDPRRASVACVQKSLRYLIYISFAGHGKTPFP